MSADDSERKILSRKELFKERRREAYKKAKERRNRDPRYIAMKEAAKEQRREAYRKVKEQRKAAEAEAKANRKAERAAVLDREHVAAEARAKLKASGAVQTADEWSKARSRPEASVGAEGGERGRPAALQELLSDFGSERIAGFPAKGSSADN